MRNANEVRAQIAEFDGYDENVMRGCVMKSCAQTVARLRRRYPGVNTAITIAEIRAYLRTLRLTNAEIRRHLAAIRSPDAPANVDTYPLEAIRSIDRHPDSEPEIALYWMAAKDPAIDLATVELRKANFVLALVEKADRCNTGCRNNLAARLVGCHPDVEVIFDLKGRVGALLTGFLVDHIARLNPAMDPREFNDQLGNINARIKQQIREKIVTTVGAYVIQGDADALRFLDENIQNIEYLDFMPPERPNVPVNEANALLTMYQQMVNAVNALADEQNQPRPVISEALRNRFILNGAAGLAALEAMPQAPVNHVGDADVARELQEQYFNELRVAGFDPINLLAALGLNVNNFLVAADAIGRNNIGGRQAQPQPLLFAGFQQAAVPQQQPFGNDRGLLAAGMRGNGQGLFAAPPAVAVQQRQQGFFAAPAVVQQQPRHEVGGQQEAELARLTESFRKAGLSQESAATKARRKLGMQ